MNAYDIFPAGTRVMVVEDAADDQLDDWDVERVAGMTGVVVRQKDHYFTREESKIAVSVEFDQEILGGVGHDCDGAAREGHGWNVLIKHLERVIAPETPEYTEWCERDQEEDT